jgi:hypothetical protein
MRGLVGMVSAAVVLALGGTVGAADWETTRRGVIDPLNTSIHRHLPGYVKKRDLDGILGIYATATGDGLTWAEGRRVYPEGEEEVVRWAGPGGPETIAARYRTLLDQFATVDKAELRIGRVGWRKGNADGYPADLRLLVRGTRSDGARLMLDQWMDVRLAERRGHWEITRETVTARETVVRRTPRFEPVTDATGLRNVHTNASSPIFRLFGGGADNPVRASSGSAVADVDGDGFEDVFLAGDPDAALFRNHGGGRFVEQTDGAAPPRPYPAAATGALFFDYDNDGWPDLFVAAVTGGNRLFRNAEGRGFVEVTERAGIAPGRWSSMGVVADYDRDGFLDLYIVTMGDHGATTPKPNFSAQNGVGNTLYRNNGNGTFTDTTKTAGVGYRGWNMAGAWGDYDGDGWPDLYVGNEFGRNALYRNQGDGTFQDVTDATGTADGGAAMGVAWGDYDGDGDLDLYVSNMHANSAWALFHPDFPAPIPWRYRLLGLIFPNEVRRRSDAYIDALARGSTLFRNDGNGAFTDVSDAAGVRDAQWGWAAEFFDYDNDGRLDLYATDGFITGPLLDDV